jgi:hypothetical protein
MVKYPPLKYYQWPLLVCIAMLSQPFLLFAQSSTEVTNPDSQLTAVDSTNVQNSLKLEEGHVAVVIVTDSLRRAKRFNIEKSRSYLTFLQDQFPSPYIQYIRGLPLQTEYEIPRKQQSEDWQFYLCFFLLGFLALIRFGYAKEFEELFSVFKHWGPSQQMYRELGAGASFGVVLLNAMSVLVLSFLVFLLLDEFGFVQSIPGWLMMAGSLAGVGAFLLFRYAMLKAAGILLPFKKEVTLFNFYEIQINRALGICLFPLIVMVAFARHPFDRYSLYAAVVVLAGFVLLRYIKGFNIGVNYFGRHFFHFLLYICALEIAPVLIIIRLLQNLGSLRFAM